MLDGRPLPISKSENDLKKERSTLAQLRSGYSRLLCSYKSSIKKEEGINVCADCVMTRHYVKHLFVFPAHPMTITPSDYGADRRTLSGSSAISKRETQIEMNMD